MNTLYVGDDENEENVTENSNKREEKEELKFDSCIPAVVRAMCLRLGEFKVLLEDDNLPDLVLPFVHLSPPNCYTSNYVYVYIIFFI